MQHTKLGREFQFAARARNARYTGEVDVAEATS